MGRTTGPKTVNTSRRMADANPAEGVVPLPFGTTERICDAADEVIRYRETGPKTVSTNRKSARKTAKISPIHFHRKLAHRTTFALPREFRCAAVRREPCVAKGPSIDIIPVIGNGVHVNRSAEKPEGRRAESETSTGPAGPVAIHPRSRTERGKSGGDGYSLDQGARALGAGK